MPKTILTQELEGTRRRGRPRKWWREGVERDLQVLGMRKWKELVTDRTKWKGHCSTGQSLQRAVVPMEEASRSKCSCSQAVRKPVRHTPLLCVQWKTPNDWQRNCPKHV